MWQSPLCRETHPHSNTECGFLSINDLVNNQGELALTLEFNSSNHQMCIEACAQLPANATRQNLAAVYISLCSDNLLIFNSLYPMPQCDTLQSDTADPPIPMFSLNTHTPLAIFASKKYKPVARKIRPIETELPSRFQIIWDIKGDPLQDMPWLNPRPPNFIPISRYTSEHRDQFKEVHVGNFLLPEEHKLVHHFMCLQNSAFTWTDQEHGYFCEDFFPLIDIPTILHKPWAQKNILIPPGIYDKVCKLIKRKIDTGIYKLSNSSYCLHWFCIVKRDRKSLHIIHSLEPLNQVTIKHSGVTPFTDQIGEHFAGCACGSMLDLYVGYDECSLAEGSHDLTTFQSLFGTLWLITLPMGWTNSVPIFHDDITCILQPKIPDTTVPYIDNVPIRGPATRYLLPNGSEEQIAENPGIHCFVWEHFQGLNCIVQHVKFCGGTFSRFKLLLCTEEIIAVGHHCTPLGRLPDITHVDKITNWGPCKTLSNVCTFLGTVDVCCIFIQNFSQHANPLVQLTCKDTSFTFGPAQIATQEDLKKALLESPALRPINYTSDLPVILTVDTSQITVGFYLCRANLNNLHKCYYACFGSISLNKHKHRFSQPKLELYRLFHALHAYKLFIVGVCNLVVEVDTCYIKGMLNNPDTAPSTSIN